MSNNDVSTETIILAAINAAGPAGDHKGAWYARVKDLAAEIALALDEKSPLTRHVEKYLGIDARFPAVILGGKVEAASKRVEVRFRPVDRDGNLGDEETIRTERTDTPEGKAMLDQVKALKHRRVLIHKRMEQNGDKKFRVLQHVIDLGAFDGDPEA